MSKNIKSIIRSALNEQLGGGHECETSTCNCVATVLTFGYYQNNFPVNGMNSEENCWNDYGNVMGNNQTNNCVKAVCKPGRGCVEISYSDPQWASTPFVGCNAMADCQTQYPNGCDPDYYDCTQATGYQCGSVNYATSHTTLTSCQTAFPNGCAPPPDAYSCDVINCTCYIDPAGSMTLATCQAALANPGSDCYCQGQKRYECVKYWSPKHGREICECVEDPNGQFTDNTSCQAALLDPNNRCYCGRGGSGWECDPATGQCFDSGSGPYPDQASCDAATDDHFNFRQGCDCQCQGCNGNNTPGCAPSPCTGALNSPIPNDDPALGAIGSTLDLSQLLTTAFKERMAPCVPHTNSPGVAHDCKFWKFISEVKMPQTKMDYVLNNPTGGFAGTSQFPNLSQTAHPKKKKKIEAKVAYLRCLRQQCCANTQWVDTAYAGGYTHTLTAPDDQGNIQNYGAGWWTDSSGVWQPPL